MIATLYKFVKIALKDILANKVRSFLTVLGILIGISSVTMMVSIGGSAQVLINQSISSRLGKNMMVVQPGQSGSGSGGLNFSFSAILSSLSDKDYEAIMNIKDGVISNVSRRQIASLKLRYGNIEEDGLIFVIDPGYFKVVDLPLKSGRYFRIGVEGVRETIISESTQKKFYKLQDPVNKKITIQGYEYTIVGVVEDAAGTFGGETYEAYLETKTYRDIYRKTDKIQSILLTAANDDQISQLKDKIIKVVRAERNILPSEKADFSVTTQTEIIETSNTILGTVTLFISVISAISLVVGGIGVMNIMLVSVKERVKEIGLRKAIGATNQVIQLQILIESVLFSLIGGLLGIVLGSLGAIGIEKVGGLPFFISSSAIMTSLGVSSVVGIVFGLYPAIQAGRLSPIEALRSN